MLEVDMRIAWVIIGVVLIVIGAVFSFVPFIQSASENTTSATVSGGHLSGIYFWNVTGFSITGKIPATVSWTANAAVEAIIATCSSFSTCASGNASLTYQNGTSGSATVQVPQGGTLGFAMGASSGGSTTGKVTVSLAQTTIGLIILVLGILLLIVGVVMKKKAKPMAAPPAQPATTNPPPSSP